MSFVHSLGTVENNPRKKGAFWAFLLRMNMHTAAKFAFGGGGDDTEWPIFVVAVANAEMLDAGDLEWNLQSVRDQAGRLPKSARRTLVAHVTGNAAIAGHEREDDPVRSQAVRVPSCPLYLPRSAWQRNNAPRPRPAQRRRVR